MVLGSDGSCPLAVLLPFTGDLRTPNLALSHAAAALMAMEDFNSRDPSIVPQLADEEYSLGECTVRFPLPWDGEGGAEGGVNNDGTRRVHSVIKDDGDRQDRTANAILETLNAMRVPGGGDDPAGNHELCAVAGAMANLPARTAATLAAASGVPFFSHGADTTKISRPPLYPLAGKLSPDEYARGDAMIGYLSSIGRDKVGVLIVCNGWAESRNEVMHRCTESMQIASSTSLQRRITSMMDAWMHD